jgi:Ca-activated chloride channel homolog
MTYNRLQSKTALSLILGVSALISIPSLAAQDVQDDEDQLNSEIVVTGSVRQGGAQDIKHFRSVAVNSNTLPRPESLTVEGLMGEHDLTLPSNRKCNQLFCLTGHAMKAALPTRPNDVLFVGLGFESNIDATSWKRAPLSVMAVVDRSGSMSGQPIANVKAGLHQMVEELGDEDRLGIAIYGTISLVHLAPTAVKGDKQRLHNVIDAIAIDGATNMEAGLKIGYDAAFAEAQTFKGKVRMMLFTDEQPNIGNTDPASFMGMAQAASRRGIGLTTIGVGVQYNGALATKISSVRGGNLFFLTGQDDAKAVFKKDFRNMVSEVAHDVAITMTPKKGYSISGVFGVPDGNMEQGRDGSISVIVPTAFLSSNGGGIFASLDKSSDRDFLPANTANDGTALMKVSLSYVDALNGEQATDQLDVGSYTDQPHLNLQRAHILVDQYLAMNAATKAYHHNGDAKQAYALLDGLQTRIKATGLPGFDGEQKLVGGLREKAALLAGYSGEVSKKTLKQMQPMRAIGRWQVMALNGVDELGRGDVMEFTADEEVITHFKKPRRGETQLSQSYQINERQIYIPDGKLMVNYNISKDKMTLYSIDGLVEIRLKRSGTS